MRRKYFFTVHEKYFFSLLVPICAPPCISSCNHAWQVRGSPIEKKDCQNNRKRHLISECGREISLSNALGEMNGDHWRQIVFWHRPFTNGILVIRSAMPGLRWYISRWKVFLACVSRCVFNQQSFRWDHMRGVGLDRVCNDPLDINPPVCRPPLTNR